MGRMASFNGGGDMQQRLTARARVGAITGPVALALVQASRRKNT
jgi:hypothetical protein